MSSYQATTEAAPGSSNAVGISCAFMGGLLLSFDVPLLKLSGADTYTLIYARGIMLFVAMYMFWLFNARLRGKSFSFINGKTGLLIAALTGASNILFVSSISATSVANVVFILAFNPLFAGLLAWVFLKEKLHLATWIAIGVALLGVGLIVADGLVVGTWRGDLMALGVAVLLAIVLTLIRASNTDQTGSAATGHLLAAIVVAPLALPATVTAEGWGWLSLNGLLVAPAATALLMIAPRYISAAIVAMFFLLETVLTPLWMWAIFEEVPSLTALIGGVVVIVALIGHSVWKLSGSKRDSTARLARRFRM